jgi:D-alanine-D-alanine ligase
MKERDFQIAVLYNEEEKTTRGEPQDIIALQYTSTVARLLHEALLVRGYPAVKIAVQDSLEDLQAQLRGYSPENTFILNNCDGFNGSNSAAVSVLELIESMGFKHTGAPAHVVALCIDKVRAKRRLLEWGVPTPAFQIFQQPEGGLRLPYPVIVKPATEDGSLGIDLSSVATSPKELFARIRYVLEQYHQPALVEEFIPGREFAISLWGNQVVEAMPVAEEDYSWVKDPLQCLITYEAKWLPESPFYQNIVIRCPADLTPQEERQVKYTAIQAYKAVGLCDLGRMDMRYHNGIPYILDINELPDLAPDSGFANTAAVAGHTYAETVEHIVRLGLEREGWL